MRALILCTALFLAMLILIGANRVYIKEVSDTLIQYCSILETPGNESRANELSAYWTDRESTVGLSVDLLTADRVTEQITLVTDYARQGNRREMLVSLARLRDAARALGRSETVSLGTLF